jgi:hypothetical protein
MRASQSGGWERRSALSEQRPGREDRQKKMGKVIREIVKTIYPNQTFIASVN